MVGCDVMEIEAMGDDLSVFLTGVVRVEQREVVRASVFKELK